MSQYLGYAVCSVCLHKFVVGFNIGILDDFLKFYGVLYFL